MTREGEPRKTTFISQMFDESWKRHEPTYRALAGIGAKQESTGVKEELNHDRPQSGKLKSVAEKVLFRFKR